MSLQKLETLLETFDEFPDPADRTDLLLSYADQFKEVPPDVATRPFPEKNHVPQCESDAYVWALRKPDGTLKLHFAVENPSGISARALATILDKTLSGLPAAEIATVDCDIVERIFRRNISMGKGMGLMAMVDAVRTLARKALPAPSFQLPAKAPTAFKSRAGSWELEAGSYSCLNVRLKRPGPVPAGALPGSILVTPWKRSLDGPPITMTSPEYSMIGRIGSFLDNPPITNRAVSPIDTETIGTPDSIVSRLSSLSWCTPIRLC